MVRVASYTDQKQKVYFLSRSEGNGVNTTSKLHGMGAETLSEGRNQTADKLLSKDGESCYLKGFCSAIWDIPICVRSDFSR